MEILRSRWPRPQTPPTSPSVCACVCVCVCVYVLHLLYRGFLFLLSDYRVGASLEPLLFDWSTAEREGPVGGPTSALAVGFVCFRFFVCVCVCVFVFVHFFPQTFLCRWGRARFFFVHLTSPSLQSIRFVYTLIEWSRVVCVRV